MTRAPPRIVTPLRFVGGVIGVWTAARMAVLMPNLLMTPAEADLPSIAALTLSPAASKREAIDAGPVETPHHDARPVAGSRHAAGGPRAPADHRINGMPARARSTPLLSPSGLIALPVERRREVPIPAPAAGGTIAIKRADAAPMAAAPVLATDAAPSRLSGGVYLYRRAEGGAPALATGGQLGGSQAGARVAWALGPAGPTRVALAARLSTPLEDARGAEAAAGVDVHPLPGRPLRISVERRIDLGGAGRDAWSAYAAGGFWKPLGGGLVADGYAQAGVVGARRRDLFADGAIRLGARRELGGGRALTLGGGAWGAAQPRVARLDIGPRAAVSLPVGRTAVTAAAEWRMRVAGDARPGSGLALTVASDF